MSLKNTYNNENATSTYPFRYEGIVNIPLYCIQDIKICYTGSAIINFYLCRIRISDEGVYMTFLAEKDGSSSYMYIDIDRKTNGYSCVSYDILESNISMGVSIRKYSEECFGSYEQKIMLDPFCIVNITESVLGSYKTLNINGSNIEAPEVLNFRASGILSISSTEVIGASKDLVNESILTKVDLDTYNYTKVSSINNIDVPGNTELTTELIIETKDSISITVIDGESYNGKNIPNIEGDVTVIVLNGDSTFPNCYGSSDEANDVK